MEYLTDRDRQILELVSVFGGRTYTEVLEHTFWHGLKNAKVQARNRMNVLEKKYKLFLKRPTGLIKPRNAYILSENGKDVVRTLFDKNIGNITISPITTQHNIMEQITYYWLKKIGREVERTIVKNWSVNHAHTPDIYYEEKGKKINVEIEKTIKTGGAYNSLFVNLQKDEIDLVLYVVEDDRFLKRMAKVLPKSEKVRLITVENLIKNCSQDGKIGAINQKTGEQLNVQKS